MTKRHTLAELAGAVARTQQLLAQMTEAFNALQRRVTPNAEAERAYWFVARVQKGAFQIASWSGKKVRWIPDPMLATGFQQHHGAHQAMKGFRPTKGVAYMLLRIVL